MKRIMIALGLMVSLLIVGQGAQMQSAQASVTAVPSMVAPGVTLLKGYTAPRKFGESPSQALKRQFADCPGNYFCTWHGSNASGTSVFYPQSYMTYYAGIYLPGSGENNTGSSWYNLIGTNTACNCYVYLYDTEYCGGWKRSLIRGQHASSNGTDNDWNDRVSSYSMTSYPPGNCLESSPGGLYYP